MLERIWDSHRAGGLDAAAAAAAAPSPEDLCYLAMLAFSDERYPDAAAFAARAAQASPGDLLFQAAAAHLAPVAREGNAREGKRNVYVSAEDPDMASRRWAVAQATFCLHAIAPAERPALLRWARAHCDVLLVAEFDAPRMDEPLSPDTARHVLERYREGLAEYAGPDLEAVAQGFLMPVLFGYADRGATRTTFQ